MEPIIGFALCALSSASRGTLTIRPCVSSNGKTLTAGTEEDYYYARDRREDQDRWAQPALVQALDDPPAGPQADELPRQQLQGQGEVSPFDLAGQPQAGERHGDPHHK